MFRLYSLFDRNLATFLDPIGLCTTQYLETVREGLASHDGTLWNESNTVTEWCSLLMNTMPMDCDWFHQQVIGDMNYNLCKRKMVFIVVLFIDSLLFRTYNIGYTTIIFGIAKFREVAYTICWIWWMNSLLLERGNLKTLKTNALYTVKYSLISTFYQSCYL